MISKLSTDKSLSRHERAILLLFSVVADSSGEACMGYDYIMRMTGIKNRTAIGSSLKRLVTTKALFRKKRHRKTACYSLGESPSGLL